MSRMYRGREIFKPLNTGWIDEDVACDTGIAVQDGRILVDLFYETYAESVINGAINVNVYVVG